MADWTYSSTGHVKYFFRIETDEGGDGTGQDRPRLQRLLRSPLGKIKQKKMQHDTALI